MFNKCCVVNCNSRRNIVRLFQFPKTEIGLQKWLKCVSTGERSYSELRKLYVCEKHFEKRYLTPKRRLRYGAYPTLFTADEITSGVPDTPVIDTQNVKPIADHAYCKAEHDDHNYCKQSYSSVTVTNPMAAGSQPVQETVTHVTDVTNPMASGSQSVEETVTYVRNVTNPVASGSQSVEETVTYVRNDDVTPIVATPRKRRRPMRLVHSTASLTPNCRKLYKEYSKSKRQLDVCRRAKRALAFSKTKTFEQLTKNLTPLAKKILWMQVKQSCKKIQGRRFTKEEKLISLCILKQSPKCYNFLKKVFILPSKQTLNKFVAEINVEAGINLHIFAAIKQEVETWTENRKYCSILFDEVALEPAVTYNKAKDRLEGFVELDEKSNEIADHALVFMLRGAISRWQQPVAFYFCKGATSAIQLKTIIKNVTAAVIDTGLKPVAFVCDQGTSFQSALKSLQGLDALVTIKDHHLSIIFDPPHLLKGLRNNFLTKNIKLNGRTSKWTDIVEVYKTDCNHAQMRLLPKLNDEHVIPHKIKKMKVKHCARVFSKTMAATLSYTAQFSSYIDGTPVSSTLKNTAEVTALFDDLFDSVNGASYGQGKGKPLRSVVTENSPHLIFWRQAIDNINRMRYVDKDGKEVFVPSQKNWITTLKSFIRIWSFFKDQGIKIMRPRYFNSDPLENFFGQVRAYNFRNNNPDCHTFKFTFRSLLITRFIKFHSESFNCEEDSAKQLLKLESLFASDNPSETENDSMDNTISEGFLAESSGSRSFNPENFQAAARRERLNVHSQAYTTGWVIRKILKDIKCSTCESNLLSDQLHTIHKWISFREYKSLTEKKKLTYPSEQSVLLFRDITKETVEYLEINPHQDNILKELKKNIKSKYSLDFLACEIHKNIAESFLDYTLRLTIFNWCNIINKILKGTDISRLPSNLPPMQLKALNKYKSKLKNKKN